MAGGCLRTTRPRPSRRTSRRSRAEPTAHTISGSFSRTRQLLPLMPGSRRATGAVTSLATAFLVATPVTLAATFSPVRRPKAANIVEKIATAFLAASATPTATTTAQTDPAGHESKKTKGVCGEMHTSSPNCTSGHKPRTAASSTHVCEVICTNGKREVEGGIEKGVGGVRSCALSRY